MEKEIDRGKRRFLLVATSAMGGAATVAFGAPFVMSMMPSERAKAAGAPVEADISKVEPGMLLAVEWRGKPVWIVRRTKPMLDSLAQLEGKLRDPKSENSEQPSYCKNPVRAIKPEYFIAVGICTHLGCSPTYRKDVGAADLGADWMGGFFCPCHGSRFDLAGRVFKDVPAPTNLAIPPHMYLTDMRLLIGEDKKGA
jgi:ubiquinol-cytochrome c reductase iron-sulfur subunit